MESSPSMTPTPAQGRRFLTAAGSGRFRPWQTAKPRRGVSADSTSPRRLTSCSRGWSQESVARRDLPRSGGCDRARIVHGGETFLATARLGDSQLASTRRPGVLARWHAPPALSPSSRPCGRRLGHCPRGVRVRHAYYAELPERPGCCGYRGRCTPFACDARCFTATAHRYAATRRARAVPAAPEPCDYLQLCRGCSVTATLDNRALRPAMGFTPA